MDTVTDFAPPANPAIPELLLKNKIQSDIDKAVANEDAKNTTLDDTPTQPKVTATPQPPRKNWWDYHGLVVAALILLLIALSSKSGS